MEELVAELGAASSARISGLPIPRDPYHAAYISHWLTVLKADKKAIFTAASKASQAVDYLDGFQPELMRSNHADELGRPPEAALLRSQKSPKSDIPCVYPLHKGLKILDLRLRWGFLLPHSPGIHRRYRERERDD